MADVATKCITANSIVGGRAITRIPVGRAATTQYFYVEPKINDQYTDAQLDTLLTNRFDDEGYYFTEHP